MTREIRKDLNRASQLYKDKNHEEAFEIYDKHYSQNPEAFKHWDKIRYCWCMYYLFIRDSDDETELVDYTERVTEIVRQDDLNNSPVCVYTQCVFKVIMFLKAEDDWEYMLYWLEKLNPKLLSENEKDSEDSRFPSKKEDYYRYLSTAHFKCGEWQECIDASAQALDTLTSFAFNGDVWHKWRMAKSYNRLGKPEDALKYLYEVVEVQKDWYILKELADCSYQVGKTDDAMKYAGRSVLADGSVNVKVNLYHLIYNILKDSDESMALKHAKLYLAIKLESGAQVAEEIEDLNIDETDLEISELEAEIRDYWAEF